MCRHAYDKRINDTCMDMCTDMCTGVWTDICTDVFVGTCIGMCTDICVGDECVRPDADIRDPAHHACETKGDVVF